jgi:hypothetical protein
MKRPSRTSGVVAREIFDFAAATSCSGQSGQLNQTSKLALSLPWTPFIAAFF